MPPFGDSSGIRVPTTGDLDDVAARTGPVRGDCDRVRASRDVPGALEPQAHRQHPEKHESLIAVDGEGQDADRQSVEEVTSPQPEYQRVGALEGGDDAGSGGQRGRGCRRWRASTSGVWSLRVGTVVHSRRHRIPGW